VLDPEKNPFLFAAQAEELKQLIIMPHWAFHQLAERVGDPKFQKV